MWQNKTLDWGGSSYFFYFAPNVNEEFIDCDFLSDVFFLFSVYNIVYNAENIFFADKFQEVKFLKIMLCSIVVDFIGLDLCTFELNQSFSIPFIIYIS